ncbi:zeta toxin family protein [Pseudomonas chlororaphis]|uniref:Uncharacterized protein conserved in bacteria n=1 Tax=Pseudomonas chlororaphis TaxID=587753 RepID=A0AAX3FRA6_9PSED|nr:zeta toxin family protein [Pseudomonas chlororaphis]AZC38290.1 hypothetical protein C4K37_3905 [Pseudomonas chlororaphis subsp. piscium]AZC44839.1 hypothetical protein C4K36_3916 [Pseudomonas chlororaphis subsp. piscium]WDG70441.1 zeta toxin family protein [Pseudomonas chlororaphis]WDH31772.1 zeta toxin family protein [Pseudomonas chlororaphis]WDH68967.1 zeta toxin family protein [Pseudomonas chlororaphis]
MIAPRLRVFAGPNGSGKSTMKSAIPFHLIGIYINPDEIEKAAKESGRLDFNDFQLEAESDEILGFIREHRLVRSTRLDEEAAKIGFSSNGLDLQTVAMNSYFASVLSDFIRNKLLEDQLSFTFETVMSSDDKIAFMLKARASGYRTYLYFVATEDPDININRVKNRVAAGGHPVPTEKVVQRYARCLNLLPAAIAASNRAYIFDNSGADLVLLAEVTDGTDLEFKVDEVPDWFMDAYVAKVSNG